jgi:hypothetical protein
MNEDDKPLIMSDEQVQRLMGVKQRVAKKKPQSNGRGAGISLLLLGFILWGFALLCGLSDWPMWIFRVAGLVSLLLGSICFGMSFEKAKGDRG